MKTLLILCLVTITTLVCQAGDTENMAARATALANLNAVIATGEAAKPAPIYFDAAADQVLKLRIQQAYPGNTAMWRYLDENPRSVPYFLGAP